MKHFLALTDRTAGEIGELLDLAAALKADRTAHRDALAGRTLAMIFQKRSTRTRVCVRAATSTERRRDIVLLRALLLVAVGGLIVASGARANASTLCLACHERSLPWDPGKVRLAYSSAWQRAQGMWLSAPGSDGCSTSSRTGAKLCRCSGHGAYLRLDRKCVVFG